MPSEGRAGRARPLRAIAMGFGVAIAAAALLMLIMVAASRVSSMPTVADNQVSRTEFEVAGLVWPVSVERGEVGCTGLAAWFRAADGKTYGLNGFASTERGYADLEPIWLEDSAANTAWRENTGTEPTYPTRRSIGDLLDRANRECRD